MANAAPNVSTWDAPIPHRPTAADFNGCTKVDDTSLPSVVLDPVTMPNSPEWNTKGLTIASIGKVIGSVLSVIFNDSGVPKLSVVIMPSNVLSTTRTFFIARTAGGATSGDTTIQWDTSQFPPSTSPPIAGRNDLALNGSIGASASVGQVRVVTAIGGTATDLPYTVEIL